MEQVENATAAFLTSRNAVDLVAYDNCARALPDVFGPRRIIVAMKSSLPTLMELFHLKVQKSRVVSPKGCVVGGVSIYWI